MKRHSSSAFGEMQEPESINELLDVVFDSDDPVVFMWRGQSDAAWPIHSGAFRRHVADRGTSPNRKGLKFYEKYLLERARHRGFDVVGGRRLSDLELLARLQHHGAATRLVDFTRSALVAVFFACEQHASTTGALLGFHTTYLRGHEGNLDERPYEEIEAKLQETDYPVTWQPPGVSARIAAQGSQFLYSRLSSEPKGSLEVPKKTNSFIAIAISPAMKKRLLPFLRSVCDIHRTSLFPDLDGFAMAHSTAVPVYGNERW